MRKIILIGSGGHAKSCIDVIESCNDFKIAGVVDKNKNRNETFSGYPILGSDKDLPQLHKKYPYALVAVGQIKSASIRENLFEKLKYIGFELPAIISSKANVSKYAKIGKGTIVMHHALINASAIIGNNCIINSKSLIEHDAVVEDHCHISTGSIINGGVKIGLKSFIGSGVITKQCISIEKRCVIGAGAIIKQNINADQVVKN